ncbi:hypothetical protein JI57_03840 [Psychromonas sp. PRT-SC03]|nr:hypothetical protein JI57_03840 [Psychromonas sp. PRT-SC03]
MKMSLSVVMGVIDKVSAPLKGMASESDSYAKKIKKVQLAQADDASALTMIASFQKLQKELDKNALESDEAAEKLLKLKKQMEATKKPSAALTSNLAKQEEKMALLIAKDKKYQDSLKSTGKRLKKTGVDVGKLDNEFERLSKSQHKSAQSIDKMSLKYKKLQRVMAPMNKMNRMIKLPSLQMVKGVGMGGVAMLGTMAGFGMIMSETASQVNELAKASSDIDMPIADLQALRMQAKGAGAEFDDMDAAIKEMSLRWGEMKQFKSGAMNDYFKNSGNNKAYQDLKNAKTVMEAYQVIIREIAAEKDTSKKNFMADEIFGGDSEKLLPVLKGGLEALNKAKQALKDTGGPVTDDEAKSTKAFTLSLSKLGAIVQSIKLKVLIPIMDKLTIVFTKFAKEFKNTEWRTEMIKEVSKTVEGLYDAFLHVVTGVLFIKDNFKGFIAILLLLKIAFIALNAVIMMNPIMLIVAAALAGIVALGYVVSYLVEKFVNVNKVIEVVGSMMEWLWEKFKLLLKVIPDALIPDAWKTSTEEAGDEVDKLNAKLGKLKDKNVKLGITTNDTLNKHSRWSSKKSFSENLSPISKVPPLTNYVMKSKAEVSVTIKSEKPLRIDKVKGDKGTNIKLDTGNMMLSY